MSNISLKQIEFALRGAQYHEDAAFSSLASARASDSCEKIVYHLRAYFWELWSVWDYILQHANRATMKLPADRVREDFLRRLRKKKPSYKFLDKLQTIYASEELVRLNRLRNHAHKWVFQPEEAVVRREDNQVLAISLRLDEQGGPETLFVERADLIFLRRAVEDLKTVGFFD